MILDSFGIGPDGERHVPCMPWPLLVLIVIILGLIWYGR